MEEIISTPTTSRIPTKKIWGAIKTLKKSIRQEIAEAVIMYCSGEGYDPETAKHDTTKALFTLIKYDLDNIAAYDTEKMSRDEKRSEINRQNRARRNKNSEDINESSTTSEENINESSTTSEENINESSTTSEENINEKTIYKNINIENRNLFLTRGVNEQKQNEILNFFYENGSSLEIAEKFISYNLANHKTFPVVWQSYATDFIRNEKQKGNNSGSGEKLLTYQEVRALEMSGKGKIADYDKIPQPNGKFLYKLKTL